jgi:hypothetical protein
MNEFDEFTLSVMSNRNHYGKYLKTNTNAQLLADIFRKEKMYYNERIIELTRDLISHEDDGGRCTDNDVNESHREYMKCCIRYLKWKDVTDMIQKEKYASDADADEDETVSNARQELDKRIQETPLHDSSSSSPSSPPSPPSPSPPRYNQEKGLISFANKMCIRKKTMDDFIVMKPAPVASSANLPQIRDYHDEIAKRY